MKKGEKHRTDKRRRTRLTVRAFCLCCDPHNCLVFCSPDDAEFYIQMDALHPLMDSMFAGN